MSHDRRLLADGGVQRAGDLPGFHLLDRRQLERPVAEHPAVHLGRRLWRNVYDHLPGAGLHEDAITDDCRLQ
jgi:hypothetical protein